jgi:hypothetical protein
MRYNRNTTSLPCCHGRFSLGCSAFARRPALSLSTSRNLNLPIRSQQADFSARERSPLGRLSTPSIRENGLIAQPAGSSEHASVDVSASLGEHRCTRCLPPQEAPFPGATRQLVDHFANHATIYPLARACSKVTEIIPKSMITVISSISVKPLSRLCI